MARGDIRIVDSGGRTANPVLKFAKCAGDTAILAGEPVKIHPTAAASGSTYAGAYYPVPLADGDGGAAGFYFLGVAAKDSTQTSSADGFVEVYLDIPGTVYSARAKTSGAADSDADIYRRQFYPLVVDLTSSTYTIDDAGTTHTAQSALLVVGGDTSADRLWFTVLDSATWRAFLSLTGKS